MSEQQVIDCTGLPSLLEVEYDEKADCLILKFPAKHIILKLPANADTCSLWKKVGFGKYHRWLWLKQDRKCADCGKPLVCPAKAKIAYLHHDPPTGTVGSRIIDYKGVTRNRILCHKCHLKSHSREGKK